MISQEFLKIISKKSANEREAHSFLKNYPGIIRGIFQCATNHDTCLSEFQLGTSHRADFIVLSAHSGAWTITFIELESPADKIFTKTGMSSLKLRQAEKQLNEWRLYWQQNRQEVKNEIAKRIRSLEIPAQNYLIGKGVNADIEISHPRTFLHDEYYIVIGRRDERVSNENGNLFRALGKSSYKLCTYDRIYDWMKFHDETYHSAEDKRDLMEIDCDFWRR